MNILLVDDDFNCCNDLAKFLERVGYGVTKSYDGMDAFEKAISNDYELIISDVKMPGLNGIDLVKRINSNNIKSKIILISGIEEIAQSISAIELGIYDFITKPVNINKLMSLIEGIKTKSIEEDNKSNEVIKNFLSKLNSKKIIDLNDIDIKYLSVFENRNMENICVFSDEMKNLFKKLDKLHEYTDIPILIEGKTGTGKEIVAKYIHYESSFNNEPFVAINCAAINKEMFEAELFGYERGAFTGAKPEGRDGFIKIAENGTLFLDEITEISLDTQTKLLRVLQEREYYKVGSGKKEISNARFIFATNVDIELLADKGFFRKDLYFRLSLCKIEIPPLNKRKNEIIPLTLYFIENLSKKLNKKIKGIESEALIKLYNYNWPGNIRELKNIITNALLFSENKIIEKDDMKFKDSRDKIHSISKRKNAIKVDAKRISLLEAKITDIPFSLEEHINSIIDRTLKRFNGNKTKAANYLGISRMQLYNRYKR